MKRAIITGATGAIGTALIKELVNDGIEVLVFIRAESKRNHHIPVHPLVQTKMCSLEELAEVRNDTGKMYDVFYHLAWSGASGPGRNDMYMQNRNVKYALDAVGAAERFGCGLFVGAGSQAEYGRIEGMLSPDTPVHPETGYGIAKLCAGEMTRLLCEQIGMRHIWTRILSVYGPCDGEGSLISTAVINMLKNEDTCFTPCNQIWDYIYSEDAARAICEASKKGKNGSVYVIGSGEARRLSEYIEIIAEATGYTKRIGFGRRPYNDKQVMHLQADISGLKRDTGFEPAVRFEEGINKLIDYYKDKQ